MSRLEIACIMFADDALRELIDRYKRRDDFENTIFIFVGDHGGGSLAVTDRMASYRIPLVIYSELLKKSGNFKGVSSHIDILPSLQILLSNNFGVDSKHVLPFIGEGLDTSHVFQAKRYLPLNIWENDKLNFILDDLVLEQDRVYTLDESFNTTLCHDEEKINRIKEAHTNYLKINKYVLANQKIWDEGIIEN